MSSAERSFKPHEYERYLLLLLEQGQTLSILIEEYTLATGIAFGMLKNKIYYVLSHLQPLLDSLTQFLSESAGLLISKRFYTLLSLLDDPEELCKAHAVYISNIVSLRGGLHERSN